MISKNETITKWQRRMFRNQYNGNEEEWATKFKNWKQVNEAQYRSEVRRQLIKKQEKKQISECPDVDDMDLLMGKRMKQKIEIEQEHESDESDSKLVAKRESPEEQWVFELKKLKVERLKFEREKQEISRNMEEIMQIVEAERLKWQRATGKLAVERESTLKLQNDLKADGTSSSENEMVDIEEQRIELEIQKEHIAQESRNLENEKKLIEKERAELEAERKRMSEEVMTADRERSEAQEMTKRLSTVHDLLKAKVENLNALLRGDAP